MLWAAARPRPGSRAPVNDWTVLRHGGPGLVPGGGFLQLQASWLGGRVAFSRADSLSDSRPFWARGAPAHFKSCAPCTCYPLAATVDTGSAFGKGCTT